MLKSGLFEDMQAPSTDFTIDGKCSCCGECCSNLLPLTQNEIKVIHKYIKKHRIKEQKKILPTSEVAFDMTCPFRNNDKKICNIYKIRPLICKLYQCNRKVNIDDGMLLAEEERLLINMREEFFKEE